MYEDEDNDGKFPDESPVEVRWLSEGPQLPRQPPPTAGRRGVDTGPDESNRAVREA